MSSPKGSGDDLTLSGHLRPIPIEQGNADCHKSSEVSSAVLRAKSKPIIAARITAKMIEEPYVPNPNPPRTGDFVNKSPKVAPNGRVKTKAIQNSVTLLSVVQKAAAATRAMVPAISPAEPANPRPELSAR